MKGLCVDLGRMSYRPCAELQRKILEAVSSGEMPDTLLFVEHDPVLTLGSSYHKENLLLPIEAYAEYGIEVSETDRGGDVTYHGPNQLVAYPIFRLALVEKDLHRFMRALEEAVIVALAELGLMGERFPPHTGVWVRGRKICAIGIKVKRWVSMHGIALNCSNDLRPFDLIVPCGIKGYGVTSLEKELKRDISLPEARAAAKGAFERVFSLALEEMGKEALLDRLKAKA